MNETYTPTSHPAGERADHVTVVKLSWPLFHPLCGNLREEPVTNGRYAPVVILAVMVTFPG